MGRSPCCAKEGLNRGAWTAQEDQILTDYIKAHGEGRWRNLPRKAGLKRCGKSCRLRWLNYLRPDIKRGNISPDEDELIIRLHKLLGNRWSLIAGRLPGRTDNEIKNYWNTNLSKKVESRPNVAPVLCSRERPNHHRASEHKPMISSESKVIPVNNSTQSPLDSHVIKTKALKCSEQVLINPPEQQQHHQELFHQNKDHVTTVWDATLQLDPNLTPAATLVPHAFGSGEDDDILAEDLLVEDFDIGEICLSELLGSDLSAGGTQELKSRNTTSLDVDHHHQLFTENNITEVQEEDEGWRVMMRDCCVGTPSFASILDCSRGDQWI